MLTAIINSILLFLPYHILSLRFHEHTHRLFVYLTSDEQENPVIGYSFISGNTQCSLYHRLESGKKDTKTLRIIRINTIAGFIGDLLCYILLTLFSLSFKQHWLASAVTIDFIIWTLFFTTSTDIETLIHPEKFECVEAKSEPQKLWMIINACLTVTAFVHHNDLTPVRLIASSIACGLFAYAYSQDKVSD